AWGFFNTAFEAQENMESYVAEQGAREMLARDPAGAAEFARKLQQDAEFGSNPHAGLEFFYQRSPSGGERLTLYPVYRVSQRPRGKCSFRSDRKVSTGGSLLRRGGIGLTERGCQAAVCVFPGGRDYPALFAAVFEPRYCQITGSASSLQRATDCWLLIQETLV